MDKERHYYSIVTLKFWKSYFIHMRPYLLFISGVAGLSGMAVAPNHNYNLLDFTFIFLACFLGYGFGQALTDCFQVDTDSISAPYRPLVKKEISTKAVIIISILGLISIASCLVYYNILNIIWGSLSIVGLLSYTFFKRRFWWAGPGSNAWIVMLLPVMGFMAFSNCGIADLLARPLLLLVIVTFFTYTNFVLIGYLKDISADKQTNYKTFPVVFGWNKTVLMGDLNLIIYATTGLILIGYGNSYSHLFFLLAILIAIAGQVYAHLTKEKNERNSTFPIISTVRSFILIHLAITVHFRNEWVWFACVLYLGYELTQYYRPQKQQI